MATMANEYKGRDLMQAVEQMDCDKLLDFAIKNKSKKCDLSFKMMLEDLSQKEIETMFELLLTVVEQNMDTLLLAEDRNTTIKKQQRTDLIRFLNAVLDLGLACFELNKGTNCKNLLTIIVNLNSRMPHLLGPLESLANKISLLCEKMFLVKNSYQKNLCCNTLLYLLKKIQQPNSTKKEIKRLHGVCDCIPIVLELETVESTQVLEYLKGCSVKSKFVNTSEGQKIIKIALGGSVCGIREIHEAIESLLPTCTTDQAVSYGKIYSSAWMYALKHEYFDVKEKLELTCIQRLVLLAVESRISKLVENALKILLQFNSQKKEASVAKMLYSIYQPILWRYIKNEDGVMRANATELFLSVFPLEDPDENIVMADQELNDQMLVIKGLLTDEFQQVRIKAVNGLCAAIMINWELFSRDMLKTYFNILVNDCGTDSSSHELRCAVAMGLKCILENPLSYALMGKVLPRFKYLFHDIHESVRLAFVQLLLRVNKIKSIKYYEVVPVNELLERLSSDKPLVKLLVCLLKNSYFPKAEGPESWLPRCMDMVKNHPGACNGFFHYIPSYIEVQDTAKFIKFSVETLHHYIFEEHKSKKICLKSRRASYKEDVVLSPPALGLDDPIMVAGLVDAVCMMWTVSRSLLEKEENKPDLKSVVSKLIKCLGHLSLYYKDSVAWRSVYFLASLMPPSSVPSLAPLCFLRLKALPEDCEEEEYGTLVECLCSHEGASFIGQVNEWLEKGLSDNQQLTPHPRKRKSRKDQHYLVEDPKPFLALKLLGRAIDTRSSQKALLLMCPEKLKETLLLMGPLQKRIEMTAGKEIKDAYFLRTFHAILLNISALLQTEDQFDSAKYLEGFLGWYQEKLLQPQLPKPCDNTSRGSSKQAPKASEDFQKLSLGILKDLCNFMCDLTIVQYLNPKSTKFLKFALSLFPLGGAILLPVCKFLSKHIIVGMGLLILDEITTLRIAPDCFSKIIHQLNNQEFNESIPPTDMKEIQAVLSESLSTMYGVNSEMDELVSSITLSILKEILSHIEPAGELQKEFVFEDISISPPTKILLGIVSRKPSIAVFFLKQLQNHVSKPEMNTKTWVSFFVIVKTIWENKKSKAVERELLVLLDKMGRIMNVQPLKMVDTNIQKDKDSSKSFEEHCLCEYKKLKEVMVPKASN